ncbi:MAG: XdhC family protein [Gemmatimonadota bacterium]
MTGPRPDGRAALATLVRTEGSSPRPTGSTMWVDGNGAIAGSVTIGGCVDARVIEHAAQVLIDWEPRLITIELGDEDAWALGMTCAGTASVLVEPVDSGNAHDPVAVILARVSAAVATGTRAVSIIELAPPWSRMLLSETGEVTGSTGDGEVDAAVVHAAREQLADGGPGGTVSLMQGTSERNFYLELAGPPATLVVFGATHVAIPLVEMARTLGMRTVVIDGRERYATRARFPAVDELVTGMPSEIAGRLDLGPTSYVVLLSHDYKYDLPVLRVVLASRAAWIGCLGSTRRRRALLEFLAGQGVPVEVLERVRIPVGLDLGARTPAEIALSVLAEIQMSRTGASGRPLTERRTSSPR